MANYMVDAALWAVGTALAPLRNSLLEKWAASVELGPNVNDLKVELMYVQALLGHTAGKEIADNPGLKEQLVTLQDLAYDADDVLDELDYFRIQDDLDEASEAADEHAKGGVVHNWILHARHTAQDVRSQISLPAKRKAADDISSTSSTVGKSFPCSSLPSLSRDDDDDDNDNDEPQKLEFHRVETSEKMQQLVKQLKKVRKIVSATVSTLGPNWCTDPNIAQSRPLTISESTEEKFLGREHIMNSIIHDITQGRHSGEVLTVIPIVGPGGMGKTTLAQHIYHSEKIQQHFDVKVWTCVSLNFNVNKLIEEIKKDIPQVHDEKGGNNARKLIEQRLKHKRFLIILDDIWDCSNEDVWKQLLLPFKKSKVLGNIIIVTTRIPAQAEMVRTIDDSIFLQGLDPGYFKELFLQIVFGDDQSRNKHANLLYIGDKIIDRLKGSPLAAKTVGKLLRKQLDLGHWNRVLESKEWEQQKGMDDIMPALKLSYYYLAPPLQRCFSYCALFPQDYNFGREELINFWIGLDVLHVSHNENKRIEDMGIRYLTELVDHGFFKKNKEYGRTYVLHDLLHDLARNISSHECLSIQSSQVRSLLTVPPTIRHLSINIDDISVESRLALKNCVDDFNTLDKKLKIGKLRSLMLFGDCFVMAFRDLFREAKSLRVVFLSKASYKVKDILQNFYSLVHLRYLRIQCYSSLVRTIFPNKLSRFYHIMVLDAKHCDIVDTPIDMGNLMKLRHFLVRKDATHSSIVNVGKLESLQELRRFVVKKEGQGFELRQLGHLVELGGSLCIADLENVLVKEEADRAKLLQKGHLQELTLQWSAGQSGDDSALEQDVLERLKPSSNLLKLSIIGHRGGTCSLWLGKDLSVKILESLCLDGVAWKTFPPIGELWLVDVPGEEISGNIPNKRFENLKRLELANLSRLRKWVLDAPCQLFPQLEELTIRDCSNLEELLISHFACCQLAAYRDLFPSLSRLVIKNCPNLSSFPPVPWTKHPSSFEIAKIGGSFCLDKLVFGKDYESKFGLKIVGMDAPQSNFWDLLAFYNLAELETLDVETCQPLPLHHLHLLPFLKSLNISCPSIDFSFVEDDSHDAQYQFPVEQLFIRKWSASGKDLTRLLSCFPKLSRLNLVGCEKITGLGVMRQRATATAGPSSSANKVGEAQIEQQQDARLEDETVALAEEELLLLPPQLQELDMYWCQKLSLRFSQLDDNKEDGRSGAGGGLHSLTSLRKLVIWVSPNLLCFNSSSCIPFPDSLEDLQLGHGYCMNASVPLWNLTSLTRLRIHYCGDLRGKGLLSLLAQGNLTELQVTGTPHFFADSEPEQELPSPSYKLQRLCVDDVAGLNPMHMLRGLLSPSLTTLEISGGGGGGATERFTEEQEDLLFIDSLEEIIISFWDSLQHLPTRLHKVPNLKRLRIECCPEIRSLPKNCLPTSLQKLVIQKCPAIRSLPEVDDLPSALQELEVYEGSEDLRRQCCKLKGIIPIVRFMISPTEGHYYSL